MPLFFIYLIRVLFFFFFFFCTERDTQRTLDLEREFNTRRKRERKFDRRREKILLLSTLSFTIVVSEGFYHYRAGNDGRLFLAADPARGGGGGRGGRVRVYISLSSLQELCDANFFPARRTFKLV